MARWEREQRHAAGKRAQQMYPNKWSIIVSQNVILLCLVYSLPALLLTQQAEPIPLKNETPRVKQHIERAKKTAGAEWTSAEHYFCEAPRTDAPNDPVIEPAKIFDNVYAIGNSGTTAYVISTSDGLIMIDALRPNQLETQLLPGFQKLGLDPAKSKWSSHSRQCGSGPLANTHLQDKTRPLR